MPTTPKINLKLKRLAHLESEYRQNAERAKDDLRRDPDHKARHRAQIRKNERKADKLLHKIRRLRELRARTAKKT